ncbi:unnamed protein product [Schistocephalus solidus]|uniref:FRAS1-related extracellular matrix protein 3 n=1 Tax=Schistocephalus solidus TaxID=70667 RepID=A0A183T0C3_SCHSO|nr:unnamed protein product [Schistocephalus solidus]
MEGIQLPDLAQVDGPGLRSVKECRRDDDPVQLLFSFQVNLSHIGGSFSVLPKDCIVVGTETASREDYLDINVTKIQGPLFAQLVNLRDPTRPVLSFRIQELRKGLIALQLLNYAEMQEKTFILTLVAIDPFMQVSQPVDLRLVSHLQPVFRLTDTEAVGTKNPFIFQVFSLPLFSFTGATSIVQKYNIQVSV